MGRHQCDCGRIYGHPDAIIACAQGRHGKGCQGCHDRDEKLEGERWEFDVLLKTLYRQKRRAIYPTLAKMLAERLGVVYRMKTGRCANGAERDGGTVSHIIPKGTGRALCGTEPGRRSDWGSHEDPEPTCEKCLAILPKEETPDE